VGNGSTSQLFVASFEAWVSTSTCFGHPPCPSCDPQFFAVKCSSKKRNRRVSQTLRSCFRARGPLGVFVASRLTPPKPLQSSLRSLFASSSTTLLRSAAMRCRVESAREEGRTVRPSSPWPFPPRAGVFCAGCPPSLRPSDVQSLQDVRCRQFSPFGRNGPPGCIGAARARAGLSKRGALKECGITANGCITSCRFRDVVNFPRNWSTQ